MFGNLKTPDVTLVQILAAVSWVVAQGVAMGLIDSNQSAFALQIASTVITAAWVIGDAVIRQGRAKAGAAVAIADATSTQTPAADAVKGRVGA